MTLSSQMTSGKTLSVLSLNLWHDRGPYAERAKRLREWIDRLDPDLIGFQEALRGRGFDQVAELLDGRGYHLDYVCASRFERKGVGTMEFGNAIASRWPIIDRETLQLPDAGDAESRARIVGRGPPSLDRSVSCPGCSL